MSIKMEVVKKAKSGNLNTLSTDKKKTIKTLPTKAKKSLKVKDKTSLEIGRTKTGKLHISQYNSKTGKYVNKYIDPLGKTHRELIREKLISVPEGYILKSNGRITEENKKDKLKEFTTTAKPGTSMKLNLDDITKKQFFNNITPNKNLRIKINNDRVYTLNERTINNIKKSLVRYEVESDFVDSATEVFRQLKKIDAISLEYVEPKVIRFSSQNGFFPYYHTTALDLSEFGIYREHQKPNYDENCVTLAFRSLGMDETDITRLKLLCKTREIPDSAFKTICESLGCKVKLNKLNSEGEKRIKRFGKDGVEYEINSIEGHSFAQKKVPVTSFALNNYSKVIGKDRWNEFYDQENRNTERFIDSFDVVKLLLKNNQIKKIIKCDEIYQSTFYDKIKDIPSLEYDELAMLKFTEKMLKQKSSLDHTDYQKCFLDFETDPTKGEHRPYGCVATYIKNLDCPDRSYSSDVFIGSYCGLNFLKSLKIDTMILIHNLKYDIRFIFKYVVGYSQIARGSTIMQAKATFFNKETKKTINLIFRNTLSMINMPLRDFGASFGLAVSKEVMPYSAYNQKTIVFDDAGNIVDDTANIKEAMAYLKSDEEKEQFMKNLNDWNLIVGKRFKHIEYSMIYCKLDTIVLMEGYLKFREWMLEITKYSVKYDNEIESDQIDIFNIISLASLSHQYFMSQGCFDKVNPLNGIPREFIQRCVVGGRVMTRNNNRIRVNSNSEDYDGISLYPSAMHRLGGYLCGLPKVIDDRRLETINKTDGYFVEIIIKNFPKRYAFPLLSIIDEDGGRKFTDDINDFKDRIINLTSIDLNEIIVHYGMVENDDFEIIRGYYYDEGRCNTLKSVINHVFEQRLKMKAAKNPIQLCYKELMNSAYGKTIMKEINDNDVYIYNETDYEKYVENHFNTIKYIDIINYDSFKVYHIKLYKPINDFGSYPHCGSEVLSMSKAIMNEVMCLADNHGITIYYQDTDSMHLPQARLQDLKDLYYSEYGRHLDGKNFGQFHCDLEINKTPGYSKRSIFLGKKVYIDDFVSYDKAKNISGYHIRMKGIPTPCIRAREDPWAVYTYLLNENDDEQIPEESFDLMLSTTGLFNFKKDMTVCARDTFIRKVSFPKGDFVEYD